MEIEQSIIAETSCCRRQHERDFRFQNIYQTFQTKNYQRYATKSINNKAGTGSSSVNRIWRKYL